MNSASPITFGCEASGSRSSASSSAPEVSKVVAGTQEESWTRRSMIVVSAELEKEADAFQAEHIGDLVRIADRRGDAMRQNATVELLRRDQRGFDVEVGVNEAGHGEQPGAVDLAGARIGLIGADDAVAADGDVGDRHAAIDDIEQADILDDQIGGHGAPALVDGTREKGFVGHAQAALGSMDLRSGSICRRRSMRSKSV